MKLSKFVALSLSTTILVQALAPAVDAAETQKVKTQEQIQLEQQQAKEAAEKEAQLKALEEKKLQEQKELELKQAEEKRLQEERELEEQKAKEKAEQELKEKQAKEKAEAEQKAKEEAEAKDKAEQAKKDAELKAAEKAKSDADRAKAEKAKAEKAAKAEQDRKNAEKAKADKIKLEKQQAAKKAKKELENQRKVAARAELNAKKAEEAAALAKASAQEESYQSEQPQQYNSVVFDQQYDSSNNFNSDIMDVVSYSQDLTTEKFVSAIGEEARYIGQKHDVYASVMIAQAILESGSGKSELSKAPNYNLFGVKGSHKGKSVKMKTLEDNGSGSLYAINAGFRKYDNISESLEDYAKLLTDDMAFYYFGATKEHAKTPQDAARFLQGRYATDTSYASKINSLIKTYNLERFDLEKTFDVTGLHNFDVKTKGKDGKKIDLNESYAKLEAYAISKLGYNYVWGGESDSEGGYDCSGLMQHAYREAFGVELPRTTYGQQNLGEKVQNFKDLQMGDLLFWNESGSDTHHVGMYLENGNFIHAPQPGEKVQITNIKEYKPTFAKRLIDVKEKEDAKEIQKKYDELKESWEKSKEK